MTERGIDPAVNGDPGADLRAPVEGLMVNADMTWRVRDCLCCWLRTETYQRDPPPLLLAALPPGKEIPELE